MKYLLIGGYAVGYHGAARPKGDLDIWVAIDLQNADALVRVFDRFGIKGLSPELFLAPEKVTRLGQVPLRLGVLTESPEFNSNPVGRVE